ncbi:MAG: quinol:cytochrome C oxidoreductase [Acidobacteriia bacterium]|nr:quinol:cytochrome C oxidoreductase [Terriglobia bacterium]
MNESGVTKMFALGAVAGLGGVLATGFAVGWERFWVNWIFWFLFVLTIGLGCLFIVALEHVVGAKWSVPLRRVPERLSSLALLMGPALLLALLSLPILYPWTRPEAQADPIIAGKAAWLNVPFFVVRVLACICLWILAYRVLVSGSIRQDREKDPRFNVRARRFAPVFIVIFGITITVVAFDWISGLEPAWYSDVFGVYIFAGTFLAGLAATTLAVLYLRGRGKLPGVEPDHIYNLGGFLFAFTVFWAYIGFAQYLLMWYANMPEEVFWYQERLQGLWGSLVLVLAVFHFFIPFLVLIPRIAKTEPKRLVWVAVLMLLAHWLDLYWMIFPVLGKGPFFSWPELSFALFFICASLLWFRRLMSRGAAMPVGDPFLREGLEFRL